MKKRPLVLTNGRVEELQSSDELDLVNNLDLVSKVNGNVATVVKGQPVYVNALGQIDTAKADAALTANVIGFVRDDSIAAGVAGQVQLQGQLYMPDWTAVTGSPSLTVNSEYYLSPTNTGTITTTPPSTAGQFLAFVGFAVDANTLMILWERPIRL